MSVEAGQKMLPRHAFALFYQDPLTIRFRQTFRSVNFNVAWWRSRPDPLCS